LKIQLALDRMEITEAMELTKKVEESIDWIEVGTSLIKEFGMASVKKLKQFFPHKTIVADIKTIDNARYEFEMAFNAGADVATVMAVSPLVTIEACMDVANKYEKTVMIDLLNSSEEQVKELLKYKEAIFCMHVSKDEQEASGVTLQRKTYSGLLSGQELQLAVAGGITIDSLENIRRSLNPGVIIIGSAITRANDPAKTAAQMKLATLKEE